MSKQMAGSWEISHLTTPQQFAAFADAYLDSAARLCRLLKKSTRASTYPRGAVVLYLTFHSVELFLKASILQKSPSERFGHNVEHLKNRYNALYRGKKYRLAIPFKTGYISFEPSEIVTRKTSLPSQDQINRYPIDKKGKV